MKSKNCENKKVKKNRTDLARVATKICYNKKTKINKNEFRAAKKRYKWRYMSKNKAFRDWKKKQKIQGNLLIEFFGFCVLMPHLTSSSTKIRQLGKCS